MFQLACMALTDAPTFLLLLKSPNHPRVKRRPLPYLSLPETISDSVVECQLIGRCGCTNFAAFRWGCTNLRRRELQSAVLHISCSAR